MSTFGVTIGGSGGYVESVDCEIKAETKQLLTSEGHHGAAQVLDKVVNFSVRGKGDNPYSAGAGTGGFAVATGASFITSCKTTTKNDDWQGWEISGVAYTYAGSGA
jgi:hypothetical protein